MLELEQLFEDVPTQLPTEPESTITPNTANCARPPDEIVTGDLLGSDI